MNRVDNIKKFANKRDIEQTQKKEDTLNRIEEYKAHIKTLKPRIDALLKVGNACLVYGIELNGSTWGRHEGYDTHQFFSNSWSHLVGFINDGKDKPVTKVGKRGGGACNWELETNGIDIEVSGNIERVLKYFIDEFDEFETEFYKYVDKVTIE